MKKLTIWLCTLLTVCSCVWMSSARAYAKELASGKCGANITWVLDYNGTLTFSGTGEMDHFSPYTRPWDGRPGAITTVVIEEGITSIGNYAFMDMEHLVSVTIPDSVGSIGGSVFQNCISLQEIRLPKGLVSIPTETFAGCVSLRSIVIPENVDHIWHGAFQGCTSLTTVTIPVKLRTIERDAFAECPNLWHVVYAGRKGQFKNIGKYPGNDALENAQLHNRCGKNVKINPVNRVCSICQRNKITTVVLCVAAVAGVTAAIVAAVRRRNRLW